MSGQRFALPYETVISATGAPLSGATLTFYLTGSSTPAVTYADQALTVPNENPVEAASNGRFPSIFLDPSVTYKVICEDGTGVQQWQADPVTAPGANVVGYTTYANIAALRAATAGSPTPLVYVDAYAGTTPRGGGWFQFVPGDNSSADNGGTIIVDHTGNRYFRLFYGPCSIENFGAVPDSGLTDNAGAINSALAACTDVLIPAQSSGAWYGFAQPLTIRTGTRLTGEGKTSILKANASFGGAGVLLQNASTAPGSLAARDDGVTIEKLTIDGNGQGGANLSLVAVSNFRIRDVQLLNGAGTGLVVQARSGVPSIYCSNGWIEDLYAFNQTGPALAITGAAEVSVTNLIADTCAISAGAAAAVLVQAATNTSTGRNIKLTNPIVRNCGGSGAAAGILFDGNGSPNLSELSVIGGSIDNQTGSGLSYRTVNVLQVIGLSVFNASQVGVNGIAGSVGSQGLVFSGVRVLSATLDGFYLYNDSAPTLSGCVASGCGRDGVRLDGGVFSAQIIGGGFYSNTGAGVREVSADSTMLWGSTRTGNGAGAQVLTGASSHSDARFVSAPIAINLGTSAYNIAHGLGQVPARVSATLRCTAAEGGWGVGMEIPIGQNSDGGGNHGVNVVNIDNVNMGYAFASQGLTITNGSGGGTFQITPGNWSLILRAWGF